MHRTIARRKICQTLGEILYLDDRIADMNSNFNYRDKLGWKTRMSRF
jgi:hypothetical protein